MERPRLRIVVAEISQDGRYLIGQRRARARMPHLWEFPGGRVEPGEDDRVALARELVEKIGAASEVGERVLALRYEYELYVVEMVVYRAQLLETPSARGVADLRWVPPEDLDGYEFPSADQHTIDELLGFCP